MGSFRGSDDRLDAEISALEGIVRVRLRRVTRDLNELERDLRALKAERARRRAQVEAPAGAAEAADAPADV